MRGTDTQIYKRRKPSLIKILREKTGRERKKYIYIVWDMGGGQKGIMNKIMVSSSTNKSVVTMHENNFRGIDRSMLKTIYTAITNVHSSKPCRSKITSTRIL